MHKIDSDGATVDNRFTEGDVALSVPATVVSAAFMNAVQGELVTLIEALGITLKTSGTDTEDQLYSAILELSKRGGRAAPISQAVVNNQAAAADVTNFPVWLSTEVLALEFLYSVHRRTDSEVLVQSGRCYITWNDETDTWELTKIGVHDSDEDDAIDVVDFSVAATGNANEYKLQYQTSNMAGASYAGTLRITDIKVIRA